MNPSQQFEKIEKQIDGLTKRIAILEIENNNLKQKNKDLESILKNMNEDIIKKESITGNNSRHQQSEFIIGWLSATIEKQYKQIREALKPNKQLKYYRPTLLEIKEYLIKYNMLPSTMEEQQEKNWTLCMSIMNNGIL
jgi:predicted  nucleic acid-binding Zn-ribbon protein